MSKYKIVNRERFSIACMVAMAICTPIVGATLWYGIHGMCRVIVALAAM